MLKAVKLETIDIEGGAPHIKRYAPNVPIEEIQKLMNEISKSTNRNQHLVVKEMNNAIKAYDKRVAEPTMTLK